MQPLPADISQFLRQEFLVHFAVHFEDEFWAANCFYAFDEAEARLIILSKTTTKHGELMLKNPKIVGTICHQTENITHLEGIQFAATARCLNDDEAAKKQAQAIYFARHPVARLKPSDVWELRFDDIKHSSNRIVFAKKTEWQR